MRIKSLDPDSATQRKDDRNFVSAPHGVLSERERESVCECVCERESVCVGERESVCRVCVNVCVCVSVCVGERGREIVCV